MIMILFGALPAGTKTYLSCRSDRQAFTKVNTQHDQLQQTLGNVFIFAQ